MSDAINPDHYKRLPAEAIEIIEAMIAGAPDNKAAYLHGQAAKYELRLWAKGKSLEDFLSDWGKHIWYALRLESHLLELIEKQKADEQQKAADLQSLKDHPFGKLKEPAWTPQIGDWVRIKKSVDAQASACIWVGSMDKYDGQIIEVEEIEDGAIVHDNLGFLFDWLEPAEQPKPTLNSDKIPEGYRKLNDSSIEPRQRGDLRWSIAEKRYIEIGFDEIGYANRENWAACRRTTGEVAGEVKSPDGWRWLEVGEVFRKGDTTNTIEPISEHWVGTQCVVKHVALRRNRFEVGEKVVAKDSREIWEVDSLVNGVYQLRKDQTFFGSYPEHLAPYIEVTEEVSGELKHPLGCPDGYRWLEVGEVIRKGDRFFNGDYWKDRNWGVGETYSTTHQKTIRRNRFEVGEKVVRVVNGVVYKVIRILSMGYQLESEFCAEVILYGKDLAPYIEETK